MKDVHLNLWKLAVTLAFVLQSGAVGAQMLGSPLISTSVGGVVSGTYGNFKYVSATQLTVPGTWCGMRTITSASCSSATPPYGAVNIACAGTVITGACTYTYSASEGIWYWLLNSTINCPSGYTALRLSIGGADAIGYTCVKT